MQHGGHLEGYLQTIGYVMIATIADQISRVSPLYARTFGRARTTLVVVTRSIGVILYL